MNNIEILEEFIDKVDIYFNNDIGECAITSKIAGIIENLIQENKELKEEIENWKFTKKYVEDNYIARAEIIKLLNNETINISGFECIAKEDLRKIVEK